MKSRSPVTLIIIGINVAVFAFIAWHQKSLTMSTSSDALAILNAGANLNPLTLGGQPWRIVTCMFLHFGIIHLAVNMYALWQLGSLLEPAMGQTRFTLLYAICGLAASIASLFFNVYVISAGASGAIFGLYGYQLGAELISSYHDWQKLKGVLINFAIFVVVNAFIAGQVSIDMSGHIGGAVAGLIIAACHFKFGVLKTSSALAIVFVVLPFTLFAVPKDQLGYYHLFQRVIKQEQRTTTLFRNQKDDNALADSLRNMQEEWKNIHHDLKTLPRIPSTVTEDTSTLADYIELRSYEANYRLHVLDESYIYLDSIETLNARFDSLPPLKHVLNYSPKEGTEEVEPDTAQQDQKSSPGNQVQVFFDKDWKEIDNNEEAIYYRIGTRDSLGRWQGAVRDYFKNGDVQMKGSYVDGLRHGVFIYYTDHHTHSSAGRYEKERSTGKWETFHWNGKLEREVYFRPRTFTKMILDSLGNVLVSGGNGNYKSWHPNGALAEEGSFLNGGRNGFWYGYYENGKPHYKESYENNQLMKGAAEGKDGRRYVYDALSELPMPEMGMPKYRDYIEKNKQTLTGNSSHGVVKVLFNVGVDGSLWDFVILESVSSQCDSEAIRLIQEGPAWRPAFLHGHEKVQSQSYMEVRF